MALLRERWGQVREGLGQVMLLSGEAGIGKSRLVEVLKEQVTGEPRAWLTPCPTPSPCDNWRQAGNKQARYRGQEGHDDPSAAS